MSHTFISHVEEDESLAQSIAEYVEKRGYRAWYYGRDSVPGVSSLIHQTGQAIENAGAVLLIVSRIALGSPNNERDCSGAWPIGGPPPRCALVSDRQFAMNISAEFNPDFRYTARNCAIRMRQKEKACVRISLTTNLNR
jgi:hypothetical protein